MVSLDATFLIDLLDGTAEAVQKAEELDSSDEPLEVTPPSAAEVLTGAYFAGGEYLSRTRDLLRGLTMLEFDGGACEEAGRIGADLMKRGQTVGWMDLLIAAVSKRHGRRLLTRDPDFSRIPGLVIESY
jgi:predicted nucleic acid-binding protein